MVNTGAAYTYSYTLVTSSRSATDSSVIEITLSQNDLNNINAISGLATSKSNTYLIAGVNTAEDKVGLSLTEITPDSALWVSNYTRDSIAPQLDSFVLNMSSGILQLTFAETVQFSSFDPTQVTIKNMPGDTGLSISLTGGMISENEGPILSLELSNDDLNDIKFYTNLGTSQSNTFLSLTSATVQDSAGNFITMIPTNDAKQTVTVIEDVVHPALNGFNLDLDSREVILTFDETVNIETFIVTNIGFQDSASDPIQVVQLSSQSSTKVTDPNTIVVILLGDNDFNEITSLFLLGTMESNTFITMISGTVEDMNTNPSVAISSSNALQITNHTQDNSRPSLIGFDLDMDANLLTLTFSESVNLTSFLASQITLQSHSSSPVYMHTLNNAGEASLPESTIIELILSEYDVNQLKSNVDLASRAANTYLSLTTAAINDMNNNPVRYE